MCLVSPPRSRLPHISAGWFSRKKGYYVSKPISFIYEGFITFWNWAPSTGSNSDRLYIMGSFFLLFPPTTNVSWSGFSSPNPGRIWGRSCLWISASWEIGRWIRDRVEREGKWEACRTDKVVRDEWVANPFFLGLLFLDNFLSSIVSEGIFVGELG